MKNSHIINQSIRFPKVFVIDVEGNKLGEMTSKEALVLAQSKDLDLVLFAEKATPPVVKIIDYGKYVYEQKKNDKKNAANQVQVKVKEIYVKPNIGEHDLKWRADNAKKWLADGDRVSFNVQTFGRLIQYEDLVHVVYEKFLVLVGDAGKAESELKKVTNRDYNVMIVPNRKGK